MKNKTTRKLPLNTEGVTSRNKLSLNSFSEYCIGHPEMRFFQALTNWFGVPKIGYLNNDVWTDMWFMEEGVDYKMNNIDKKVK